MNIFYLKYIGIIVICIGLFSTGYYKGYNNQKNINEIKLLKTTIDSQNYQIQKQQQTINTEREINKAGNEANKILTVKIDKLNKDANKLRERINNEKDIIDNSNRITIDFVRYLNEAAAGYDSMPADTPTTYQFNGNAGIVEPSNVLNITTDNYYRCNKYIIQLKELIKYNQKLNILINEK